MEEFALAEDRSKILDQLIPGTEEYYYYTCLHLEQQGRFDDVEKLLGPWVSHHGETAKVTEIRHRHALLTWDKDPAARAEYLRRALGVVFDHQRESEQSELRYPSALDPALIGWAAFGKRALERGDDMSAFTDAGLDALLADAADARAAVALERLSGGRLSALLQCVRRPDGPLLLPAILRDLDDKSSGGFGSLPIHRLLVREQLDALLAARPRSIDETAFVETMLLKLRPGPEVDWENDADLAATYLDTLFSFLARCSPAFNTHKAHVLYHRLERDRQRGVYDRARFLAYLQLPRNAVYARPESVRRSQVELANLQQDLRSVTGLPAVSNDEPLVRDYLVHFFRAGEALAAFADYLRDDYLKPIFAETRLVYGIGDLEACYPMLGDPAALQALKERVDIALLATNPTVFSADAEVTLDVEVKNVEVLVVKVFEINTLNYFLATGRAPGTDLDLDGLVATHEETHRYTEPPVRRVPRRFSFAMLKKPGVYVIELIGNGRSSRAVIRKGALYCVERSGAAGHVLQVFDDAGRLCKDASVWLAGKEFSAKEDGAIHIPFSTAPGRQALLLRHGRIDTPAWLDHRAEQYGFSAAIYVDRESLKERKKADIVVRAALTCNAAPVSLGLLEEPTLELETIDRSGVTSKKELGLPLSATKDAVYTFMVPEALARLTITVRGKVTSLTRGDKVELSDSRSFQLNDIDGSTHVDDLHLARTEAGYVVYLLGKTGEPRAGQHLSMAIVHRGFNLEMHVPLQTDRDGRVTLGELADIVSLRAKSPSGVEERWSLEGDRCTLPSVLHAAVGEPIRVPYLGRATTLAAAHIALLERRAGSYTRNALSAIKRDGGAVVLAGLDAGDYELVLKEQGQSINVRVTGGRREGRSFHTRARVLEAQEAPLVEITRVDVTSDAVTLVLGGAGANARVHAFGTRFQPAYDAFLELSRVPRSALAVYPGSVTRSSYVSGRDIGDEYRYILERKLQKKYPGSMLARPGLLLNPWPVRKTETSRAEPKTGSAYQPSPAMAPMPGAPPMARHGGGDGGSPFFANLDFLRQGTALALNLTPDADGRVRVARATLSACNQVRFVVVDQAQTLAVELALPEATAPHEDRRLLHHLDPDVAFTEKKQVSVLGTGDVLHIADITTSKLEPYDSLGKVYALSQALCQGAAATLADFSFVTRWPGLSAEEQRTLYGKFACHELNFFLAERDAKFFAAVILPYVRNKKDKTFLDHYLMGDDLAAYLRPWAYGRLNVVERILLGRRILDERGPLARHIADRCELLPRDLERQAFLFRAALQGSALDADDALGLFAAKGEAEAPAPSIDASIAMSMGGAMSAGPMPVMKAAAPRARRAKASLEEASGGDHDGFGADADLLEREKARPFFRALDQTEEWAENDYYRLTRDQQTAELVTVNAFWRDFAAHCAKGGDGPFLSPHFPEASRNFTEVMLALAVSALPFAADKPEVSYEQAQMRLAAKSATVLFHQEIKRATPAAERVPILVSQNYFRMDDRYHYEDGEQRDKYVEDELLVHTVYICQLVLTNPTSSRQKLDVLLQIPAGAIAVNNGFQTKGMAVQLESYATQSIEYAFYFPLPGKFPHYPAQVSKNEELIAAAAPKTLQVVAAPSRVDERSWAFVSQRGTPEQVLRFLAEENIERVELEKIAWRMQSEDLFEKTIALLERRHVYNHTLYGYALCHRQARALCEYLQHCDALVSALGPALVSPVLEVDPVARGSHEHLEYAPLVNARAHRLGPKRKILNDRFAAQWARLLDVLSHKAKKDDTDWLAVAYYLLLQDRIEEGMQALLRVDHARVASVLQLDYMRVCVALLGENVDEARTLALRHAEHPVERWRTAFQNALAHIDEARGGSAKVSDARDRDQRQGQLAGSEPAFDFSVEGRKVTVSYRHLSSVQVSYYAMDIELLFSRQPFVQGDVGRFAFITPNKVEVVTLPVGETRVSFDVPELFQSANVIIELTAGGVRKAQTYFAHALDVQLLESYGQVAVTEQGNNAPVAKAYVKVYARMRGGAVQFFKDGYSDLRGRFDYASLSTGELDATERLAILVMSEAHGAVVREAAPPKR